LFPG